MTIIKTEKEGGQDSKIMKNYFEIRVMYYEDTGKVNNFNGKIIDSQEIYKQIVEHVSISKLAELVNSINEAGNLAKQDEDV